MRRVVPLLCTLAGLVIGLLGVALALGGAYLAWLGGSWAYIVLGLLMAGVGFSVMAQRTIALPLSILLSLVAAGWAFGEVGDVFWLVLPRVGVFLVLPIVVGVLAPFFGSTERNPVGGAVRSGALRSGGVPRAWGLGIAAVYAIIFCGVILGVFQPHAEVTADASQQPKADGALGQQNGNDWPAWGRNLTGDRFAPYTQINAQNVTDLKLAWTFHTGDLAIDGSEYQVTPLKIADTLYLCTPLNKVIALDPVTGKQKWRFDPHMQVTRGNKGWKRCRGVSYADLTTMSLLGPDAKAFGPEETPASADQASSVPAPAAPPVETATPAPVAITAETPCARRIVSTTNDARLFELDAATGALCEDFGDHGMVNLLEGLGPTAPGSYYLTSAPLVADGVIMVGGKINDNMTVGEPSGVIRGYDVRTGRLVWAWDASRGDKDSRPLPAGQIYATETPNFWGTASYDPKLGLAFIPMGNQTPDFWTGNRHDYSDEYTDAILALDIRTGQEHWHFRTANNDMFDYDVTSQPILYDMPDGKGETTPVVVALTKRSQIFVLDRRTGKPVVPVTDRKVATDGMPGQRISPVQPYSALSIGVDPLKESDMWGGTVFDQLYCRIAFRKMRWEGEFTPLSDKQKTLIWPGYYGGSNWGGGALDPQTGVLVVNDIRMAMWGQFIKREDAAHAGLVPSTEGEYSEQLGTPWGVERSMFVSPLGAPCFKPPYGSLTAIDLKTQKTLWQVPVGSIQDAAIHGVFGQKGIIPHLYVPIGMPTMGGPMLTQGNLAFFHGSLDNYFRAFDLRTGKEVWRERLPVGGQGTPMTYVEKGRQYVLVVAGGATRTGTNANKGDYVLAYALPATP
ncbi:membrane-bound PQQ-dependent dehydrogenase, glucose/quinate/shikimate family [Asaia krungthepensis]|uniref:membrane-bound PQQ-dependent dehydrogenase, glucose/quinate/shikimate family n=1 Tax=Asaia krungthepensis TaxID=220990 RepID=UPI002230913B|nr:membrane-bound PQQ-dependent dehydrogenase, glucose/quinate/shikimate family [Asaia krungthepensis]